MCTWSLSHVDICSQLNLNLSCFPCFFISYQWKLVLHTEDSFANGRPRAWVCCTKVTSKCMCMVNGYSITLNPLNNRRQHSKTLYLSTLPMARVQPIYNTAPLSAHWLKSRVNQEAKFLCVDWLCLLGKHGCPQDLAQWWMQGHYWRHPQGSRFFCGDIQNFWNLIASGVSTLSLQGEHPLQEILDLPL